MVLKGRPQNFQVFGPSPLSAFHTVWGPSLGPFWSHLWLQAASHEAAADLGPLQPIGKMSQVPSANRSQSHAVPTLSEQQS